MSRNRLPYRKKHNILISEEAYAFLKATKGLNHSEPNDRTLDRYIADCQQKDISKIMEERDQARRTISKLYERIRELEKKNTLISSY